MNTALWFWEDQPTAARWNSEVDAAMIAESFDKRRPIGRRYRNRHGRCYELAWRTLMDLEDDTTATLVHGSVTQWKGFGDRIGHAWLEAGGEVYDPVANEVVSMAQYTAERSPMVERRYARLEAAHNAVTLDHYGPWHTPACR
jgi:hypothetical protein